ncbi:peroxiredoxin [Candidatus Wolfebacteria bacterium]|nr:MAG: peroxiredoxin [Candidatus Wolfebacteria bacterium]
MENKQIPNVVFKTQEREGDAHAQTCFSFEWKDLTTDDIFKDKKVILFALPGAFTPTCSSTHLPGYEKHYDEFRELGVDSVVCLSVNDAFVMFEWGKHQLAEKVTLLPDGSGLFTREMGMLVKKNDLGFGERSWRYSMYVENGEIKKIFEEAGKSDNFSDDPFEVSDAETMLEYLKNR